MATSGKLEAEVEIYSNAGKFWTSIRDSSAIFPKVLADSDTKVEVIEGDGKIVGSVRQITFGEGSELLKTSKQRIDTVDDATRTVTYSVIEGDVLKYYKTSPSSQEGRGTLGSSTVPPP